MRTEPPGAAPGSHGERALERAARLATQWTGSTGAFALAFGVVLAWLVTGPLYDFSDTWQLVINTGTTVVTFLMVFLIQRSQNKESRALQLKLDEILAAMRGASNRMIAAEDMSESELDALAAKFRALAGKIESGRLGERAAVSTRERSATRDNPR